MTAMPDRPTPERIDALRIRADNTGAFEVAFTGDDAELLLGEIDALRDQITADAHAHRCAVAALSEMRDTAISERDAALAEAKVLRQGLSSIETAKRHDRESFADDTEFSDWAISRARHALSRHGGGA